MSDTAAPLLSIVMPVRNEGLNLKIMLKILRAVVEFPYEVLVVYDTPTDSSRAVVDGLSRDYPFVIGVHNERGRGILNALTAGVERSRGRYVLIFAADEVGPVLAVDDMLALMEGGCDFVSCTRYAHGGRRLGGSWIGGQLSRAALIPSWSGSTAAAWQTSPAGLRPHRLGASAPSGRARSSVGPRLSPSQPWASRKPVFTG